MKKTVNINLSGQVFQIDEDAYGELEAYIAVIRNKYKQAEGGEDIINDIEARLAEMFAELLEGRTVISTGDVDIVIERMGRPEEFEADEETEEELFANPDRKKHRRLFRNPDDKVAGGVLSGISAYLGVEDPIWLRIVFIVFLFMSFGTALLIYIIALIIIPEAKTSSEKLQMRGEAINIENIERTFKESMDSLKDNFNGSSKGGRRKTANGALSKFVHGMADLAVLFVRVIIKVLGFAFTIMGFLLVLGMVIALILPSSITDLGLGQYLSLVYPNGFQAALAVSGFGLLILIPVIALMLLGIRLMAGRRIMPRGIGTAMVGLWVLGIILSSWSAIHLHKQNKYTKSHVEYTTVETPANGLLHMSVLKDDLYDEHYVEFMGFGDYRVENDTIYVRDQITLDVIQSKDGDYKLETTYFADGTDRDEAFNNASFIFYDDRVDSNGMVFPVYFKVPEAMGIHDQRIKMTLHLPVGQSVYLDKDLREIIYDIKNVTNTYDGNMVGHIWEMRKEGLTCTDCGFEETGNKKGVTWSSTPGTDARVFEVKPFNELKLAGHYRVTIARGDEYKVLAEGPDEVVKKLELYQDKDLLELDNDEGIFNNGEEMHVWVYVPTLQELNIEGAVTVNVQDMETDKLELEIHGASECDMTITAQTLTLDMEGASKLSLNGTAQRLQVKMDGAAELNAFDFTTAEAKLELDGACEAEVHATESLDATADGVSNIRYMGSPKISSDVSGFSSIKPR